MSCNSIVPEHRCTIACFREDIAELKAEVEAWKNAAREASLRTYDGLYQENKRLKEENQRYAEQSKTYLDTVRELRENLMQYQSEAQRMFDNEKARMLKIIKEVNCCPGGPNLILKRISGKD